MDAVRSSKSHCHLLGGAAEDCLGQGSRELEGVVAMGVALLENADGFFQESCRWLTK